MEKVIKLIKEEFVAFDKLIDNKIQTLTDKLNQKIESLSNDLQKGKDLSIENTVNNVAEEILTNTLEDLKKTIDFVQPYIKDTIVTEVNINPEPH